MDYCKRRMSGLGLRGWRNDARVKMAHAVNERKHQLGEPRAATRIANPIPYGHGDIRIHSRLRNDLHGRPNNGARSARRMAQFFRVSPCVISTHLRCRLRRDCPAEDRASPVDRSQGHRGLLPDLDGYPTVEALKDGCSDSNIVQVETLLAGFSRQPHRRNPEPEVRAVLLCLSSPIHDCRSRLSYLDANPVPWPYCQYCVQPNRRRLHHLCPLHGRESDDLCSTCCMGPTDWWGYSYFNGRMDCC